LRTLGSSSANIRSGSSFALGSRLASMPYAHNTCPFGSRACVVQSASDRLCGRSSRETRSVASASRIAGQWPGQLSLRAA
jgi:hypothetical protein